MKVLVTGNAGFIGYHLTKKLISLGYKVVGLDSVNDYYDQNLKWDRLLNLGINSELELNQHFHNDYLHFYRVKLEDKDKIFEIFKKEKPDAVCNLAAQAGVRYSIENPYAYIDSNIIGFQNVIEACREFGIKNFSFASSSSVYGGNKNLPFNSKDKVDCPISLYAATKKSNELVAYTYSHLFGISCTGLRFFTVYGPWGRPDMALYLFADALRSNKRIDVFNHGDMSRDFTYIDDIVEGIIKIIQNPAKKPKKPSESNSTQAPYKIHNIGNNNPVKLMDFINEIEKSFGKKFKINFKDLQPGDVQSTYADVDDLIQDFNYKPKTTISFGINEFIKWYKSYNKIK